MKRNKMILVISAFLCLSAPLAFAGTLTVINNCTSTADSAKGVIQVSNVQDVSNNVKCNTNTPVTIQPGHRFECDLGTGRWVQSMNYCTYNSTSSTCNWTYNYKLRGSGSSIQIMSSNSSGKDDCHF